MQQTAANLASQKPLNLPRLLLKLAVCIVGIGIISFSSAILYLIQLGSDPYQLLAVSVHLRLGISYGQANNLLNGAIILFMLLFKRRYIKLSLFLCLLVSGAFTDFFTGLLSPFVSAALPLVVRLALALASCILLAFGVYLYITPALGASPADSVGLILADITGQPYRIIRIGTDTTFALLGVLLGATLGVATIMTAFLTGPFIGVFQRLLDRKPWIQKLAEKSA